jgi:hypothetical protein
MAWAWGSRSAARLSKPIVGGCGRPVASRGAPSFSLRFPLLDAPSVIDVAYWCSLPVPGRTCKRSKGVDMACSPSRAGSTALCAIATFPCVTRPSDDAICSQLSAQPAREDENVRRRRPNGRDREPVEFARGDPFGEWRAHKIGLEGVGCERRPSHGDALPRDRRIEAQRGVRIDRPGGQGQIRASPRRLAHIENPCGPAGRSAGRTSHCQRRLSAPCVIGSCLVRVNDRRKADHQSVLRREDHEARHVERRRFRSRNPL